LADEAGLTSSKLNKSFLGLLDYADGFQDANHVLYFLIKMKSHHENDSQKYVFYNFLDFLLFLEKYNNLVVPQEMLVDGMTVDTIKKAYRELLKITSVLEESMREVARKTEIVQCLKNALGGVTKPKYERLKDFSKILLSPETAALDQHHDQGWRRFVRQALNILFALSETEDMRIDQTFQSYL